MNVNGSLDNFTVKATEFVKDFRILFYGVGPAETNRQVDDYFVRAIPYFLVLILLELFVGWMKGIQLYRKNDSFASMMLGSVQLMVGFWTNFLNLSAYIWIYDNCRVFDLNQASWLVWTIGFLLVDLGYYWMHRFAHEYHLLWSAHGVHHSGEDYNFATALRQGAFQGLYSWIFKLPSAFFVSPLVFSHHSALNTLYQYWIHTVVVGDLGIVEYVLNTPSHHRMHHRPPGNCNYAGVLILWDVMFGTFIKEDKQRDYYGLAKQYKTFDPLWANFEHVDRMLSHTDPSQSRDIKFYFSLLLKRRVRAKWIFRPMDCFKPHRKQKESLWNIPNSSTREKYNGSMSDCSPLVNYYTNFLILVSSVVTAVVLLVGPSLSNRELCAAVMVCWLLFFSVSHLFDGFNQGRNQNTFRILTFLFISTYFYFKHEDNPMKEKACFLFQVFSVLDAVTWYCLSNRSIYAPAEKAK